MVELKRVYIPDDEQEEQPTVQPRKLPSGKINISSGEDAFVEEEEDVVA